MKESESFHNFRFKPLQLPLSATVGRPPPPPPTPPPLSDLYLSTLAQSVASDGDDDLYRTVAAIAVMRPPGSHGLSKVRKVRVEEKKSLVGVSLRLRMSSGQQNIQSRLKAAGWSVNVSWSRQKTPPRDEMVHFGNIVAVRNPEAKHRMVLCLVGVLPFGVVLIRPYNMLQDLGLSSGLQAPTSWLRGCDGFGRPLRPDSQDRPKSGQAHGWEEGTYNKSGCCEMCFTLRHAFC